MDWLPFGFFGTALLYASVGFGGGSTYNALLALAGTDFTVLPIISLSCNILVVSGACIRFARAGQVPWRKALLLALIAAPLAFLGGLTPIREQTFLLTLAVCLIFAGLALLLPRPGERDSHPTRLAAWAPLAVAPLGYLAGLVGIGGGIFLAPLLHLMRWGQARAIAGTAAAFILVNSIAGIAGQLAKSDGFNRFAAIEGNALLFPAVVVGGLIGSLIGSTRLSPRHLSIATAILILYVGGQLAYRFVMMASGG